ncbi:sulfatase-like hydrolase/transferase [Thalassoglobus sp. JC818]|uniref:sulfatase family protein n=1 Tax=Thalassoglobus sp. JC818 TaxID=3232136 RepID=UPI00345A9012
MRRIRPMLMFGILLLTTSLSAAEERPNILFILTDDQAPWALGLSGHPHAHTPHLDELFQSGAYLPNSFTVTPVCSPSRVSTLTSRYGSEMGITDWLNPRVEPDHGIEPGIPTWPEELRRTGYQTALIGKWHLGLLDSQHPTQFGYVDFMGFRGGGTSPFRPTLEVDGSTQTVNGLTTDILTDEAIRWLRLYDKKDGPFALSLHYRAPHARWLPVRDEDWEPFDGLDPELPHPDYPDLNVEYVKRRTREYLASVAGVDRNVGKLLEELELLQLHENTIIIYTSDHGYNMGHNGIWHKGNGHWIVNTPPPATENIPRGQRPNMYDHSIRVPTAICWPGVIEADTVIDETVSNLDWFPTILSMANIPVSDDLMLRGHDLTPLLKGDEAEWDNDFYGEYTTKHQSQTQMRMYRTPRWKLVRDFRNPERDELYDLQNDPEERTNLYDSDDPKIQETIRDLSTKMSREMQALNDSVWSEKQN